MQESCSDTLEYYYSIMEQIKNLKKIQEEVRQKIIYENILESENFYCINTMARGAINYKGISEYFLDLDEIDLDSFRNKSFNYIKVCKK